MANKGEIIQALGNVGITIRNESSDVDIREYINDSLQYMLALVELEDQFGIEFSEDFYTLDLFASLNNLIIVVSNFQKEMF
ncbi:hypothetical protein IGI37_001793 [Enterococcus sp. AZ194]|uniref:hypothetical protein n=1 Tax=Enterococcus sp. AZ194 TaxID=2774629 RepID=UPI003F240CF6